MIRALLVTHGNLGAEFLRTAELIVGPQQGVRILSNKELSSETLSEAIRSELLSYSGEETVIFVDVAGGSCLSACRIEEGERNKIKVISGVNLPMVLEFFHYRGRMPFAELVERVAAKGRGGIQTL